MDAKHKSNGRNHHKGDKTVLNTHQKSPSKTKGKKEKYYIKLQEELRS